MSPYRYGYGTDPQRELRDDLTYIGALFSTFLVLGTVLGLTKGLGLLVAAAASFGIASVVAAPLMVVVILGVRRRRREVAELRAQGLDDLMLGIDEERRGLRPRATRRRGARHEP